MEMTEKNVWAQRLWVAMSRQSFGRMPVMGQQLLARPGRRGARRDAALCRCCPQQGREQQGGVVVVAALALGRKQGNRLVLPVAGGVQLGVQAALGAADMLRSPFCSRLAAVQRALKGTASSISRSRAPPLAVRTAKMREHAVAAPPDEADVERLGRPVAGRRVPPLQAMPDHVDDSSDHPPVVDARQRGNNGSIRRICVMKSRTMPGVHHLWPGWNHGAPNRARGPDSG